MDPARLMILVFFLKFSQPLPTTVNVKIVNVNADTFALSNRKRGPARLIIFFFSSSVLKVFLGSVRIYSVLLFGTTQDDQRRPLNKGLNSGSHRTKPC
jgi:hypothetical protein